MNPKNNGSLPQFLQNWVFLYFFSYISCRNDFLTLLVFARKKARDDGHTGIKKISDRKKSNSLKGIGSSGNPEYFKLNTLKQI